jgi:hypothetical protein
MEVRNPYSLTCASTAYRVQYYRSRAPRPAPQSALALRLPKKKTARTPLALKHQVLCRHAAARPCCKAACVCAPAPHAWVPWRTRCRVSRVLDALAAAGRRLSRAVPLPATQDQLGHQHVRARAPPRGAAVRQVFPSGGERPVLCVAVHRHDRRARHAGDDDSHQPADWRHPRQRVRASFYAFTRCTAHRRHAACNRVHHRRDMQSFVCGVWPGTSRSRECCLCR